MQRQQQLERWLTSLFPGQPFSLTSASSDASFRRYFRAKFDDGRTLIVMDAPPQHEDCRPFVKVAGMLHEIGLNAPQILAQDLEQGFLLLSDLGTQTFLDVIDESNADGMFRDATDALIQWQLASKPDVLPAYDEALLRRELNLFPEWYVGRHLGMELDDKQKQVLESAFALLIKSNLAQPSVYVHRDFMPRNLMVSTPSPGILDFQDAVYGPISYDVVSLFKDAFISWEEERVLDGAVRYWEKAKRAGLPVSQDFGEFYRDFEWMGMQRHFKVLGIFARINYRDGKPKYLADTPRFMEYVRKVAQRYNAFGLLLKLLDQLENRQDETGYTF
ncbi:anomeric MurNAc/GlcNAc kinase [Novimethylophilus kurashikiensis]|uniref:Anomeric MurNAc/GlcNAc kinase n=1 Tax=Novimethylophilus kurashikiensis TaxID=1825523 RepID=A0A2R5FBL3_9PROT|nr:phosphotransferase [Novimethylophilus kurashikiensis]GBG15602.1 anomeric MurNAc/GlcNAc kinase [Novimethylophilus kurashikiensis]